MTVKYALVPALHLLMIISLGACTLGSGLSSSATSSKGSGGSTSAGGNTGTQANPESSPVQGSSATGASAAATTVRFSIASGAITYASSAILSFPDASSQTEKWDVCIARNADCSGCETQTLQESITQSSLATGVAAFSALYINKSTQERTACVTASTKVHPLEVQALYSAAPNWNDYVKSADTETVCSGTEDLYSDCVHGGDKRLVTTEETSCEGLSMVDSAGAFEWTCEVSEGLARFTSALETTKGLADLVDSSSWKSLSVTLTTSKTEGASNPSAWWSNPVQPLPDNSASSATPTPIALETAGTIYTLASSRATAGYNINADKIGLVMLAGAELSEHGTANNHDLTTKELTASPNQQSILAAGSQKFVWIEGNIRGSVFPNSLSAGVSIGDCSFVEVRNVHFSDISETLKINVKSSRIENVTLDEGRIFAVTSNSAQGILFRNISAPKGQFGLMGHDHLIDDLEAGRLSLSYARDNTVRNFHLLQSPTGRGIDIQNISKNNLFESGRISYQSSSSVYIGEGCSSNRFSRMTITSSNRYAFEIVGTFAKPIEDTLLSEVLISSGRDGISATETKDLHIVSTSILLQGGATGGAPLVTESDQATVLHNVLIAGNKSDAIALWNSTAPTVSQIYIDSGDDWSISLYGASHHLRLTGNLVGPGPSCAAAATVVSPGWDVFAGSGCLALSGDDFLKSLSTATLVGRLLTADAENPDDNSSLTVAGGNITDQSSFENRFRSWGMAGTWGEDAATGLCTDPSTCSIWDFGLSSSDTSIRNRSDTPGTENAKLSATSACPSVTLANKTLTDAFGGQFLKLAIEEAGDSIGDDDGLCETGETCIYTPSIGVDQGYDQFEGATFETCSQGESPALAGITLKAYSNE